MKTYKILLICFLGVLCIAAYSVSDNYHQALVLTSHVKVKRSDEVTDINDAMDSLMPTLQQQIRNWNLDPLRLTDLEANDLTNCQLTGISTIFRAGDSKLYRVLVQSENRGKYIVDADVGFSNIHGACDIRKTFVFLSYWGTLSLSTINVTTHLRMSIYTDGDSHPVLDSVLVDVPWEVQLQANGQGSLSFVVKTLIRLLRHRMRQLLENAMQKQIRIKLSEYLNGLTIRDVDNFLAQNHAAK